jgi:hypothetical protein
MIYHADDGRLQSVLSWSGDLLCVCDALKAGLELIKPQVDHR